MSKTLIIAEKPSVATDLARVLGKLPEIGKFTKKKDYFENDHAYISSAVGHLVELKMPLTPEGKKLPWSMKHLPVIPEKFELQPIERVWGVIKNNIAASPCKTMAELMPRLRAVAEAKVTEAVWLGSLRKAQLKQKKFAAQPLEAEFSDAPEENEAGVATP